MDDTRGRVDIVGDVQSMTMFEGESFDTVLCTQVLEHLPSPAEAIREMARVLRPGGVLILSAPHLSMVHEAPHDYYRFTSFVLHRLIAEEGLKEVTLHPTSGLVAFVSHPLSLVLWTTLGRLPVLRWPARIVNFIFLNLVAAVDRVIGLKSRFPVGHVLVASKPEA